ncbi:MAG: hypothetical protein ACLUFV_03635 [Acutalibacteraceae bacterium]
MAFEKYLAFLEQGGRMTFTELCAVGQVVSPFTEGRYEEGRFRCEGMACRQ